MSQNRYYSSVYPPTTLTSAISNGSVTSMSVASITGQPSSFPYTMLIDWGLSTQEAVSVTASSGSGPYTLTITRGIDGTVAQSHVNGAIVVHGVTAEDYNEAQVHIATGTSSASYPGVIHGLQSGSSVVGTTDTQTLTNKTLGAATFTGSITLSEAAAAGGLEKLTNTTSAPTAYNVQWVAAAAADKQLGVSVSGDANNRFQSDSNGKLQWGPGGATAVDTDLYREAAGTLQTDGALIVGTSLTAASEVLSEASATGPVLSVTNTTAAPTNGNVKVVSAAATDTSISHQVSGDTVARMATNASGKISWSSGSASSDLDLYRNAAGELKTDESITAVGNVTVGGAQLLAGGSGVLGVNNAGTAPTSAPSGGYVSYGKTGYAKWRGTDGLDYNTGSLFLVVGSGGFTASSTTAATITGLSATVGAFTYVINCWIPFEGGSAAGTAKFNFTAPTISVGLVSGQFQGTAFSAPTLFSGTTALQTANVYTSATLATTLVQYFQATIYATFSASGTFGLQLAEGTSSDTVIVPQGAYIEIQPVA